MIIEIEIDLSKEESDNRDAKSEEFAHKYKDTFAGLYTACVLSYRAGFNYCIKKFHQEYHKAFTDFMRFPHSREIEKLKRKLEKAIEQRNKHITQVAGYEGNWYHDECIIEEATMIANDDKELEEIK
ncbi:MAG: hypothetical protein H7836_04285 [Magnetococcus sp. YQC-3]